MTEILDLINPPPPKSARGKLRHAVYQHMEATDGRTIVSTWQVWRHGQPVAVGLPTRAAAKHEADRLNLAEFGALATRKRRGQSGGPSHG